jgi:hypothetical protein
LSLAPPSRPRRGGCSVTRSLAATIAFHEATFEEEEHLEGQGLIGELIEEKIPKLSLNNTN